MATSTLDHHDRAAQAESAWAALPHGGHDAIVLRVVCTRSHHVAAVYRTGAGLVYRAPVRPRSHGDRDLPDDPHGGQGPHAWLDLLEAVDADDAMPAWCDCGHRTLSRASVREWVHSGAGRVVIN